MHVPAGVYHFVRQLFENTRAEILFSKTRGLYIDIQRGVRQGCPASMILFSLIMDPILRWLADRHLSPRSRLRGYAKDLRVYLCQLEIEIPIVRLALMAFDAAAGLSLNIENCCIIPFDVATVRLGKCVERN